MGRAHPERPSAATEAARSPTRTPGSPWPTRPRPSSWPRWTARSSSSPCRRSSAASTSTRWAPGNISYLLWMIMGYRLVQAVLVVNLGRLGDMFGRVQMYNAGFVVFTVASILLSFDPFQGSARGAVADRLAVPAGDRRVDADGQLGGDPHRRVPGRTARLRARHQPDRRAGRHVHRPGRRRPARRLGLARGVLDQPAGRRVRHAVGLPEAARQRRAAPRQDRLVGQHHVRARPRRGARRHHLRHPALRRQLDGLASPGGARRADRRRRAAAGLRGHRDARSPSRCSG